jgi:hypothetical protein
LGIITELIIQTGESIVFKEWRGFFFNTISIVCLLLFVMTASGQDLNKPKNTDVYFLVGTSFTMGRGASFNSSSLDQVQRHRLTKIGASFGVGINHNFSKHISLNIRLLSEQKGGDDNADHYNYNYNSGQPYVTYLYTINENTTSNYITLSVIPQYIFGRNFIVGIGIFSGTPYKSITQNKYYNFSPSIPPSHYNSIQVLEKVDFGLCFNAGYTIPYKQVNLTIQFTNNYGLINTLTSTQVPVLYSNTYTILFGISYDKLTKKLFRKQTL